MLVHFPDTSFLFLQVSCVLLVLGPTLKKWTENLFLFVCVVSDVKFCASFSWNKLWVISNDVLLLINKLSLSSKCKFVEWCESVIIHSSRKQQNCVLAAKYWGFMYFAGLSTNFCHSMVAISAFVEKLWSTFTHRVFYVWKFV